MTTEKLTRKCTRKDSVRETHNAKENSIAMLTQGGLQFKLRKVPAEHKNKYQFIAQTASSLGRLIQVQKHVVERISLDDKSSQEAERLLPRTSPCASTHRSSGQRHSIEAAELGKMKRLREEYFSPLGTRMRKAMTIYPMI